MLQYRVISGNNHCVLASLTPREERTPDAVRHRNEYGLLEEVGQQFSVRE